MPNPPVTRTDLPFPKRAGKVRDVYDLGDRLLIVATDRISAFDCVMPNGIPDKGKVLTGMSLFWFGLFQDDVDSHLLTSDAAAYPDNLKPFVEQLRGRSMLVNKADVIPIECVARGYLAGSGWKEYQQSQSVCGVALPAGLKLCDKLPRPIFTPATKEESGHDVNVSFDAAAAAVGRDVVEHLRERTLALYEKAANYARLRGIIIADTKFEFGRLPGGRIILIDEVLTPDSSRFWPLDGYAPGKDPPSYDKQFVRNYLDGLSWDKRPPAPVLPTDVIEGTRQRYVEAYERLTGRTWS